MAVRIWVTLKSILWRKSVKTQLWIVFWCSHWESIRIPSSAGIPIFKRSVRACLRDDWTYRRLNLPFLQVWTQVWILLWITFPFGWCYILCGHLWFYEVLWEQNHIVLNFSNFIVNATLVAELVYWANPEVPSSRWKLKVLHSLIYERIKIIKL